MYPTNIAQAGQTTLNNLANYAAQQQACQQVDPPSASVLNQHLSHVLHLRDMVGGALDHVRSIADGLLGAQPSPLAKPEGKNGAVDSPLTARITDSLDTVHSLLDELHAQINRLDRL